MLLSMIWRNGMKVVVPNYYNQFKCIAEKCHHNCCIGWEIDIDDHACDRLGGARHALDAAAACCYIRPLLSF